MHTEVFWIGGPWKGRLAISPRPRGGDWLDEEVLAWQKLALQVVVSLLTSDEVTELDLDAEKATCLRYTFEYISFPIPDRSVPATRSATMDLVRHLEYRLELGSSVLIHCRAGIGRSALLAAYLLVSAGLDQEAAFQRIADARGRPVPDTFEQRQWVERFASDFSSTAETR